MKTTILLILFIAVLAGAFLPVSSQEAKGEIEADRKSEDSDIGNAAVISLEEIVREAYRGWGDWKPGQSFELDETNLKFEVLETTVQPVNPQTGKQNPLDSYEGCNEAPTPTKVVDTQKKSFTRTVTASVTAGIKTKKELKLSAGIPKFGEIGGKGSLEISLSGTVGGELVETTEYTVERTYVDPPFSKTRGEIFVQDVDLETTWKSTIEITAELHPETGTRDVRVFLRDIGKRGYANLWSSTHKAARWVGDVNRVQFDASGVIKVQAGQLVVGETRIVQRLRPGIDRCTRSDSGRQLLSSNSTSSVRVGSAVQS